MQSQPLPEQRAADIAYDMLETYRHATAETGTPIVEAELVEATGLAHPAARPVDADVDQWFDLQNAGGAARIVSDIELAEHLTLIETRRVLERLIAASAARRATPLQRKDILTYAKKWSPQPKKMT